MRAAAINPENLGGMLAVLKQVREEKTIPAENVSNCEDCGLSSSVLLSLSGARGIIRRQGHRALLQPRRRKPDGAPQYRGRSAADAAQFRRHGHSRAPQAPAPGWTAKRQLAVPQRSGRSQLCYLPTATHPA